MSKASGRYVYTDNTHSGSFLTGFDMWREVLVKALLVLMHSVSLNKDKLHNYQTITTERHGRKAPWYCCTTSFSQQEAQTSATDTTAGH